MRVMTLGAIHEAQPLPSSTAVGEVLGGEPGGVLHVLTSTLLRAFLIAPGVALSGARGGRLVAGALVGSLSVTVGVFLWHGLYPVSRVIDSNGGGSGGGGGGGGTSPGGGIPAPGNGSLALSADSQQSVSQVIDAQGRVISG